MDKIAVHTSMLGLSMRSKKKPKPVSIEELDIISQVHTCDVYLFVYAVGYVSTKYDLRKECRNTTLMKS